MGGAPLMCACTPLAKAAALLGLALTELLARPGQTKPGREALAKEQGTRLGVQHQ